MNVQQIEPHPRRQPTQVPARTPWPLAIRQGALFVILGFISVWAGERWLDIQPAYAAFAVTGVGFIFFLRWWPPRGLREAEDREGATRGQ